MDNEKNNPTPSLLSSVYSSFKEIFFFFICALIVVVPVRIFIAQPYVVSGESMYPTFEEGDYLIVDQLSYRFREPMRGDIIVFRFPLEPSKFFIKRVIGLPHETITIDRGRVSILTSNGEEIFLNEPYIENTSSEDFSLPLDTDEYFAMGDNRAGSFDSRMWGVLPKEKIVGRAFLRLLPLPEIGYLPGKETYFSNTSNSDTIE